MANYLSSIFNSQVTSVSDEVARLKKQINDQNKIINYLLKQNEFQRKFNDYMIQNMSEEIEPTRYEHLMEAFSNMTNEQLKNGSSKMYLSQFSDLPNNKYKHIMGFLATHLNRHNNKESSDTFFEYLMSCSSVTVSVKDYLEENSETIDFELFLFKKNYLED